jgi:excisionase family DNA binding protein
MPDGYISTGEAAKMLGIDRLTVNRYLAKGILAGEKHPITGRCKINKESVLALMEKCGMIREEQIESQGNSDSRERTDTSGQGDENETKRLSPHCG